MIFRNLSVKVCEVFQSASKRMLVFDFQYDGIRRRVHFEIGDDAGIESVIIDIAVANTLFLKEVC